MDIKTEYDASSGFIIWNTYSAQIYFVNPPTILSTPGPIPGFLRTQITVSALNVEKCEARHIYCITIICCNGAAIKTWNLGLQCFPQYMHAVVHVKC